MWNFTDAGFTSVVEYDPPVSKTKWDPDLKKNVPFDDGILSKLPADYHAADKTTLSSHVLVRARIKEDLTWLKTYDPDAIETEDKLADYQYRLVMRRAAYAQAMYDKVMTLDYNSHVKETIDRRAPKVAGGRYMALSSIWSACAKWQPNTPWGGTVSYGGYGGTSYDSATGKTTSLAQGKPHQTSYWDKSLGKWITPNKAGGSDPKALPAGKAVAKSTSEGPDEIISDKAELDQILDDLEKDNPWLEPQSQLDIGETQDGLRVTAEATRNTMVAQVKDIVKELGRACEVEALVDELQETWGTVDVETIPHEILVDLTEEYESVSTILAAM